MPGHDDQFEPTYNWVWDPEHAVVIGTGALVVLILVWLAIVALNRWADNHDGPLDYP